MASWGRRRSSTSRRTGPPRRTVGGTGTDRLPKSLIKEGIKKYRGQKRSLFLYYINQTFTKTRCLKKIDFVKQTPPPDIGHVPFKVEYFKPSLTMEVSQGGFLRFFFSSEFLVETETTKYKISQFFTKIVFLKWLVTQKLNFFVGFPPSEQDFFVILHLSLN